MNLDRVSESKNQVSLAYFAGQNPPEKLPLISVTVQGCLVYNLFL